MNKVLVILNPAAHSDRAGTLEQQILSLSPHIVIRTTASTGDAEKLARQGVLDGYQKIVAAGGDGTVNEVVNGIADSRTSLGILPLGTMNVFALELGIPANNLSQAWGIIESGSTRLIDLPVANGTYFVQLAGVGLDAEVVRQTSRHSKKALGPLSYIVSLASAVSRQPPLIRLRTAEGHSCEGCFALIGNGRHYGGPFTMFQSAALDDGKLDIIVFKNQSHWDAIRYMQNLLFGTHSTLPDVEYFQATRIDVASDTRVPYELDGEFAGETPVRFEFAPHPLSVLAPEASLAASSRAS